MKCRLLSLVLIATTAVCAVSAASQQAPAKEQCPEGKCKMSLYTGMKLSDSQKSKLKELDDKRMANRKEKAEARKAKAEQRRVAKQTKKMQRDSVRRANRLEYLHQVKSIVGNDNYVIFLENLAVQKAAKQEGKPGEPGKFGKPGKPGKPGKKGKDMGPGPRGEMPPAPAPDEAPEN